MEQQSVSNEKLDEEKQTEPKQSILEFLLSFDQSKTKKQPLFPEDTTPIPPSDPLPNITLPPTNNESNTTSNFIISSNSQNNTSNSTLPFNINEFLVKTNDEFLKTNSTPNNTPNNTPTLNNTTLSSSPQKENTSTSIFSLMNNIISPSEQKTKQNNHHKKSNSQDGNEIKRNSLAPPKSTTQTFFAKLKQKGGENILKELANFVNEFNIKAPSSIDDQARIVRNFVDNMEIKIEKHPLWKDASEDEMDGVIEGIEKFILTKIEALTFQSHIKDPENEELSKKIVQLQFITPKHLEIDSSVIKEETIQLAAKELNKMNTFKAPRDKQICILNCCKVIASLFSQYSKDPSNSGADAFLPLCIYVVLQANPKNLHTNLKYIEKFRNPQKALTEAGYYFTLILSAATFIRTVNSSQLSIDSQEFEKKMKEFSKLSNNIREEKNFEDEIFLKGKELPCQFIHMNPDELRLGEISALFNEYKLYYYLCKKQEKDIERLIEEIRKLRNTK